MIFRVTKASTEVLVIQNVVGANDRK